MCTSADLRLARVAGGILGRVYLQALEQVEVDRETLLDGPTGASRAAIDAGEGSQRQVAKRFRVSDSFVTRLIQRRRDAGALARKPHGGGPRPALGFPNEYDWRCGSPSAPMPP